MSNSTEIIVITNGQTDKKSKVVKIWSRVKAKARFLLSRRIYTLMQQLNQWDYRLTGFIQNPINQPYEDLAPSKNITNEKTYTEALQWALRNSDIQNIALTGPYGSGKSSILRSFENANKQYKYLNISLATFNDQAEANEENRKLVETSILQQIFYHVKDKKIPDSRFKRIKRAGRLQRWLITLSILVCFVAGIYLFWPSFFTKVSGFTEYEKVNRDTMVYSSLLLLFLGMAAVVYYGFRTFRNKRFSKLNLTSGEFELTQDESTSILNKYLDEIIYFFEVTNYDVVIIEDLDRFNDPEIFTKLREINTLINNSQQINRRVVFIYAVRDDMFTDKSRTKFFEFIIPVIPVINPSNSVDILLEKIKTSGVHNLITEEFIHDITLYIDDMRMLKNVINEYIIYKEKIGLRLVQDKLLGMMIYKNLYPKDFADLHINKGKVYSVIATKARYIQSLVVSIEQQIAERVNLVERAEKESLKSVRELRSLYLLTLIQKYPKGEYDPNAILIGGNTYTLEQAKDENPFFILSTSEQIQYHRHGSNYNLRMNFLELEKLVDSEKTYREREREIKLKTLSELKAIEAEIQTLKVQKNKLQEQSLSQILQSVSEDLVADIKAEKLLVYLLRYGYIDESYYSYISYFYEGSITKEDNDFVLSVKNHEAKPYTFNLTKTEQLLRKLRPAEFETPYILNFQLIDFIIARKEEYGGYFDKVVDQIRSGKKIPISFLDEYLHRTSHVPAMVESVASRWTGWWDHIQNSADVPTEAKDWYLRLILQHASVESILKLDTERKLSTYIAQKADFLDLVLDTAYQDKIKTILKKLAIQFEALQIPDGAQDMFGFIYENNLYQLNEKMIERVIETQHSEAKIDVTLLRKANYTTIQKSGCQHLISYIQQNIGSYLANVFLFLESNICESEDTVIHLLKTTGVDHETKSKIIQKEEVKVSDISQVDSEFWYLLAQYSRMLPTWMNVTTYYDHVVEIDGCLLSFLNQEENYKSLGKQKIEVRLDLTVTPDELYVQLISKKELTDAAYSALLDVFDITYESFEVKDLSQYKINALIKHKKILLTVNNFQWLKSNHPRLHLELIKVNKTNFFAAQTDYDLSAEDLVSLLNWDQLSFTECQMLISNIAEGLFASSSLLFETVYKYAVQQGVKLSTFQLDQMITRLPMPAQIEMVTSQIPNLLVDDITRYLTMIGGPYPRLTGRGNPRIERNEMNFTLLMALRLHGYISSFTEENEDEFRVYTKNR